MAPAKKKSAPTSAPTTVEDLIALVDKTYGPGTMTTASHEDLEVVRWPTGELPLDDLLDGGIPRGRMIEVFGPYSTLKSYFVYRSIAAVQRAGGRCALVDTEHSYDPEWAAELGVDVDALLIARPKTAEEAIGIVEALVRQRFDLIGFDSIAAAIPAQHQEVAAGEDTQPGALARVMSKGLARLTAANKHTSIIFVNQTREKIGVTFGSPMTTSGGKAMGFYASYRMSFTRIEKVYEKIQVWEIDKMVERRQCVAHKIMVSLEKSKLSAPNADAVFVYDLRTGRIDTGSYIIGKAMEKGLVTRSSAAWFQVPAVMDKPVHGLPAFNKYLEDNPEIIEWLEGELSAGA